MAWLVVMLLVVAPAPVADQALDVLAGCQVVSDAPCIAAAARLKAEGARALPAITRRIEALGVPGQLLVASVLADDVAEGSSGVMLKLVRSNKADGGVRALAIDELARRRDERLSAMLQTLLDDGSPLVRQAVARVAGNTITARDTKLIALLARAAADPEPAVRAEALFGLGFCQCDAAGPALVRGLADSDPTARLAAAEGLALARWAPSVVALVPLLREDALVARAAGRALRFQTAERFDDDPVAWERWLAGRPSAPGSGR